MRKHPSTPQTKAPPIKRPRKLAECGTSKASECEPSSLEQLLGLSRAEFFNEHWERAPLHARGARDRLGSAFAGLPCWSNLLTLLHEASTAAARKKGCSVIVLKDQTPTAAYDSAAAGYLDGCSAIVNHAEKVSETVAQLCLQLHQLILQVRIQPPRRIRFL